MKRAIILGMVLIGCVSTTQAFEMATVTVGNPGNTDDTHGDGYGGVDYEYRIGKLEVTAGQYRDFLNAVDPAGSNPYGLYDSDMDSDYMGCQITWNAGSSTYDFSGGTAEAPGSTTTDWEDRPVNCVSWGDAARFCNWLHNGQPTGQLTGNPVQDAGSTEDGSYYLNGAMTNAELFAIVREPDATWVIPSEDEWYKAAYHYNDGVTGNYWDYPTGTEAATPPTSEAPPGMDMANGSANYYDFEGSEWAIGTPYYRSEVGAYDAKPSDSPYGTFDQGGNVWEWNEAMPDDLRRGLRGGCFYFNDVSLHAADRQHYSPAGGDVSIGFRVAEVSEPLSPPAVAPPPHDTPKNRVLSIDPTTNDVEVAYQVELTESAYFGASVGGKWWVSDPEDLGDNIWRSRLVADPPVPRVWTEAVVHIADRAVVSVATYAVRATLDPTAPSPAFSDDLVIATIAKPGEKYWADCVGSLGAESWGPPNGEVNMDDVMAAVQKFQQLETAPHLTWVDVNGEVPDGVLNFGDIQMIVNGFKGDPYPFSAPLRPAMVLIPGGEFEMGDHHGEGSPDELPVHAVYVDSFYMEVYEVTNQQYADALNWADAQGLIEVDAGVVYATGGGDPYCDTYEADPESRIHWDGAVFTVTAEKEDHPMLELSWYGAVAYANWRSAQEGRDPSYDLSTWECDFEANGYRLPTEAEWEYAARGGEHDPYYRYPWGDAIDGSNANYYDSGDPYEGPWPGTRTTPVGYYDGTQTPAGVDMANGYGLYDVAGNAREWCNDWYDEDYYASSPYDNPRGPATGTFRVLRGGSWDLIAYFSRCATRFWTYPSLRYGHYGFRLALDIQ